MLRVSKKTDYGIVLLTAIVTASDTRVSYSARELAKMTHLPLPMVGKILKGLAKEGILTSHRGTRGGYALARAPERISLVDIVSAMEGPIAMTECAEAPGECEHEALCPVQVNWLDINLLIRQALAGISLLDMTRPSLGLVTLSGESGTSDSIEAQ